MKDLDKSVNAHDLVAKIQSAFADNCRPKVWPSKISNLVISSKANPSSSISDESTATAQLFSGVDWANLDAKLYAEISKGFIEPYLSFHSHEAFKYYLPAYMLIIINSDNARSHLLLPLVVALTVTNDSRKQILQSWQQERFAQFSPLQAAVIAEFLVWAAEKFGVTSGMIGDDESWSNFEQPIAYWRSLSK